MSRKQRWDFTDIIDLDVEIEFRCKGFYDPGRSQGDPDDCYAPEGDEEREILSVVVDGKKISCSGLDDWVKLLQPIINKYEVDIIEQSKGEDRNDDL